MDFVENDHLARDAEGAHEAVLDVHRGHQRLVDGADGERREQAAFGGAEPRAAGRGLRAEVELPQPGVAVQEQRGPVGRVRFEHTVEEALDPLVDAVGGQLRRQREVDAASFASRHEGIGGVERGFGFADAHRRFEDIDAGATGRLDQAALDWARLEVENLPERQPRFEARRRESGGIDGGGDALLPRLAGVVEGRAGADPVRHGGQPGKHACVQRIADFREPFACCLHEQRQKPRPLELPRRAAERLRIGGSSADVRRVAVVAPGNRGDGFACFQRFESALAHTRMAAPAFIFID